MSILPVPIPNLLTSSLSPKPNEKAIKDGNLSDRWHEIMGSNDWKGLLDPLDPLLRLELIKYGEFSQATHDAFINDIYSTKYATCKFNIDDFFTADQLRPQVGYNATKFLYVTSKNNFWPWNIEKPKNPNWVESDAWMGFVAVSDDETTKKLGRRDICVSWRGSVTGTEWAEDFAFLPGNVKSAGIPSPDPNVLVHGGFLSLYTQADENQSSARTDTLAEIKRLINEVYSGEEASITVTGHSLGAALALLNAYDVVESKANVRTPGGEAVYVCAVTFAGPRVGNTDFKDRVEALKLKVLRVVSQHDPVPLVPPPLPGILLRYTHVGEKLAVNSDDSPYLKPILAKDAAPHDLEGYLHLIDGYHGTGKKFESATGRDVSLVNKESGFLKEDNNIPKVWKIDLNTGMVKKDGHWVHT